MTINNFLAKLDELAKPGDFQFDGDLIRSTEKNAAGRYYCPVCWVAKQLGLNPYDDSINVYTAKLNMINYDKRFVANAADDANSKTYRVVRDGLLKACKLVN